MRNPTFISICVVALTYTKRAELKAELLQLLRGATVAVYDVDNRGYIYGDTPDEWHPFEDNKSIIDYLHDAGFREASLSRLIESSNRPEDLATLETKVDLYIFDPLFLTLEGEVPNLINHLQGAIRGGNKHFCILVPERLPEELRKRLCQTCEQKLPVLKLAYEAEGIGEWKAESPSRLSAFLSRLYFQISGRPSPEMLDKLRQMLGAYGVKDPHLDGSPRMASL